MPSITASDGDRDYLHVPILCYHSVNDSDNIEYDHVSTKVFKEHLDFISKNYTVIPLALLVDALESKVDCPRNAIVLTFDDGYKDNYNNVFPLLKQFGCHATIFLPTGFIEGEFVFISHQEFGPMSWDQIREMYSSGLVAFGAHTHSHNILTDLGDTDIRAEITSSKEILESRLGTQVEYFAYPNGQGEDIPQGSLELLKALKFRAACSTFWRTRNKRSNLFVLNRVMMNGRDSVEILKRKVSGDYDYIYYIHKLRAFFSCLLRIKGTWLTVKRQKA